MNDIVQIISTLGFPIVACLLLGYFVKTQTENYREDIKELQREHKEEAQRMTEAINNNTLVIQKLCDKMEVDNEKNDE